MTIFFDFNGTILDDLDLTFEILNKMLQEEGLPTVTKERYLDIFGFPIKDYYIKAGFDFNKKPFDVLAKRFIEEYQPRSMHLKLHDYLVESIMDLRQSGFKIICLSASEINNLKEQLKNYKIEHLFDDILGTSDVHAKSKVDIAKNYVKLNNLDVNHIIMIGDTDHDLEVAKSIGSEAILYSKGHQNHNRWDHPYIIHSFKNLKKEILNIWEKR